MINTIKSNGDRIEVKLSLYLLKDDGVNIMYCPALDLSGYGDAKKESRERVSKKARQISISASLFIQRVFSS